MNIKIILDDVEYVGSIELVEKLPKQSLEFQNNLARFKAPYKIVGTRNDESFKCLCGSIGSRAVIVEDANHEQFVVGYSCVKHIPELRS
jgi:hypothetical protein